MQQARTITLSHEDFAAELKKGKPTGAASTVDILMKAKAPPIIVKGRHRLSSSDGGEVHIRPSIIAAAAQVRCPYLLHESFSLVSTERSVFSSSDDMAK